MMLQHRQYLFASFKYFQICLPPCGLLVEVAWVQGQLAAKAGCGHVGPAQRISRLVACGIDYNQSHSPGWTPCPTVR